MTAALHVFMDRLLDYAGLFPPARLDMPAAVRTFAQHLDSEFSWMLGCFICPVGRLDEFAAERSKLEAHGSIVLSVLGTRPEGALDLRDKVLADAAAVSKIQADGWVNTGQLEVKWPRTLVSEDALAEYRDALSGARCSYDRVFFEIDRSEGWESDVTEMAKALSATDPAFGFKIRTGGVEAALYPSAAEVAVAIEACRDAGIPLKATAGLHHPLRHDRSDPDVTEHGFFNVFAAAAVAFGRSVDRATLLSVLEDRNSGSFVFDETGLRWRGLTVSLDELRDARSKLAVSFGSCSFDEPLEDLETLDLL